MGIENEDVTTENEITDTETEPTEQGSTQETETTPAETGAESETQPGPTGKKSDWQKKFGTPEKLYDGYRNIQSVKDKIEKEYNELKKKQQQTDSEEKQKLDFNELYKVDPESAVRQLIEAVANDVVEKRFGRTIEFSNEQMLNTIINKAKEVYPDFDFDNEKNQKGLEKELSKLDLEYRQKNPVDALVLAIRNIVGDKDIKDRIRKEEQKKKEAHTEGDTYTVPKSKPENEDAEIERITKTGRDSVGPLGG